MRGKNWDDVLAKETGIKKPKTLNPADYCKSGSESSEQIALFMQCALYVGKYPRT